MLSPKKQSLFPPFATTFDGDTATCSQYLGRARGMLSLMLRSTPPVKSRIEKTGDTEIRVTTNPNHVYIKDESATLYCTSFNDTDLGAQVYKKPYPPITQGGLIDAGDNPDYLPLPAPDYKTRKNYWVDDKEKNTVSWQYIQITIAGVPYKYGKIAIQGLETSTNNWGEFLEPVCCALISDSQLVVIYIKRLNRHDTGKVRMCVVYDYTLDFINQKINLSHVSALNLTTAGYGDGIGGSGDDAYSNRVLLGFLSDCKTVIYREIGIIEATPTKLKAFKLADDYLSVLPDDTLIYLSPLAGSHTETTGVISESPPHGWARIIDEWESPLLFIEIRGKQVWFINRVNHRDEYFEEIMAAILYIPIRTVSGSSVYSLCKWSDANGLTVADFKTSSGSSNTTETYNPITYEVIRTYHDESMGEISVFAMPIAANDVIYAEYSLGRDYVYSTGYYDADADVEIPPHYISDTSTTSGSVKSKRLGALLPYTDAIAHSIECAYTKGAAVGAIEASNIHDGSPLIKSFVLDYKKNKKHLIDAQLTNISVTKLPTVTP